MHDVSLSLTRPNLHNGMRGGPDRLRLLLRRLWRLAVLGYRRRRQRHALARLDDRLLRDIGLTADQARQETGKPWWRQ